MYLLHEDHFIHGNNFTLFWVTLVCGIFTWVPGQRWDDIFILFCIFFTFFFWLHECQACCQICPRLYYFRIYSAVFMSPKLFIDDSLSVLGMLYSGRTFARRTFALPSVMWSLVFPLVPIHVFSMYVFTMLKVIQTFRSIEIVLLNCWKDLNFELQRAFVMPYIWLLC